MRARDYPHATIGAVGVVDGQPHSGDVRALHAVPIGVVLMPCHRQTVAGAFDDEVGHDENEIGAEHALHCIQHARMPAQLQPERMLRMRLSEILGPGIDLLMFPVFINHLPHRQITQHRIQLFSHHRDFLCIHYTLIYTISLGMVLGMASVHLGILCLYFRKFDL